MVDFKIEITKDRVSVSHADGGWPPDAGTAIVFGVLSVVTVCAVAACLTTYEVQLSPSNWPLAAIILFAGTLLWTAFRNLFPAGESMTCDRSALTIGRIPGTSLRGRMSYEIIPISTIKEVQFDSVAIGGRTPVMGLRFKVAGETKKTLAGLESPEAARILDALASLGVNVARDPAMPMMVDMALSRRKHFGGVL
jgi:hypothetical protein